MAIIETTVDDFSKGIVNDSRDPRKGVARMVTNFNLADTPRLTPYRDSEDGDSASATSKKQNFEIALRTGTTYSLYALGVKSGAATAEVTYKNLTTGAANDLDDNGWTNTTNNQSASVTAFFNLFKYYTKTGLIYGAKTNKIWAYDPSGSASFDEDVISTDGGSSFNFTNIAQGLVHSKDDVLYIPYDNIIASNNNKTWVNAAITIPAHLKINSICEYGNYLAIGASPLSGIGNSRVYLWDRDSSLTTLSESIDWGVGELKVLEEVDGYLVGISKVGGTSDAFVGRVIFRYLVGNRARKYDELVTGSSSITLLTVKQKIDNRVYFMLSCTINGAVREGLWSFGRSLLEDSFTIVHERTPNNDTALTANGQVRGFYKVGDFTFISYINASSVFAISKTNDQSNFTATSIYESRIFGTLSPSFKKDLLGATVTTPFLPTAGQIVLEYAVDENIGTDTWTNIFTEATDNSISFSAVNSLPKDYKEIQFRIESTGGGEITGFTFKEKVTGKRNYD